MPTHHLFLLCSARERGNSEQLARLAARSLPEGSQQTWLHLSHHPLPPFEDLRHSTGTYPPPEGHARVLLEATLEATDLVVVTPLYWYSLPALAQRYFDEWSAWLRLEGVDFRARMAGKKLHVVTTHTGTREEVEPLLGSLRFTARYMKMQHGGILLGLGSRPGDVLRDQQAMQEALTFFHGDPHD